MHQTVKPSICQNPAASVCLRDGVLTRQQHWHVVLLTALARRHVWHVVTSAAVDGCHAVNPSNTFLPLSSH
jgi:hypothetical protein